MENKVSEKIRLVLNELAILNQPEHKNDKIFYRLEDLRRMRSLGAELYFLADTAAKQGEVLFDEEKTAPIVSVIDTLTSTEPQQPEPAIVQEVTPQPEPEPVPEPEPKPEVVITEMNETFEMPPARLDEPLPETQLTEEKLTEHEPAPEVLQSHRNEAPKFTAAHISSQLSLTRRFEYINNLFGGNSELFMEFLDELGYSKSADEAMTVFDRFADKGNWRRRQETADDFRRTLRKLF